MNRARQLYLEDLSYELLETERDRVSWLAETLLVRAPG
jgi:hypothetical protein